MRVIKVLLTLVALSYAVLPPLVDFNTTHALHPEWPAHARFHLVWLVVTNNLMGLLAIFLIWRAADRAGVLLGGAISAFVLGGFLVATLSMPLYAGALADPGGVEPGPGNLDANLTAFGAMFVVNALVLLWASAKTAKR